MRFGLIENALNRALITFDSNDLYKDIEDKISVIKYSLVKNHGFVADNFGIEKAEEIATGIEYIIYGTKQ